ncbi:proton-coupled amino acid transporter-like protein CG1139 [Scaptodrosophila lebanonensis]|uniref:Proton-coupled amino acid transporter-like protein CG1139 n=1 Tax=Drosophila lebanonensis TaxID=7225 RepID=A0A6J2TDR8_DROLE|nr:proton-coupled amino acid transporter-like protein CG1139 [Scaptodrosophila lebanonensis]
MKRAMAAKKPKRRQTFEDKKPVLRCLNTGNLSPYQKFQRSIGSTLAFDPNIKRIYPQQMTDTEAFINLIKCAFGTGCLAMPRAYYNAGWLMGIISTVLISSFIVYAMHVLLSDINQLCRRYGMSLLSYSEAMELAIMNGPIWLHPYHKPFAFMVDVFLCVYHFGVDCVYIVFIAKNMKLLGDIYLTPIDMRIYMALLTLPLLLTYLIRDLKYLVPLALLSNVLLTISIIILLTFIFDDLPSLEEREAIQSLSQYPLFFGTVLFAIESVGVILALERNMMHPEHYLGTFGVLNRAMFVVVVFYTLFGLFGYWQYGEDISSSILNNLSTDDILPQCIMAMFAMGIFFSYALQGYVTMDIIWTHYIEPQIQENAKYSLEVLVRMAVVVASVLCAIGYPNFGLLLSFVGSFCLAQLGLIYPGIIDLCLWYEQGYGRGNYLLWRSVLFIVVGLCGGIAGTVVSLRSMIDQYNTRR